MLFSLFVTLLNVMLMPFGITPGPGELDPPEGD